MPDQSQRQDSPPRPRIRLVEGFKYEPQPARRDSPPPMLGFVVGVVLGLAMWAAVVILCMVIA